MKLKKIKQCRNCGVLTQITSKTCLRCGGKLCANPKASMKLSEKMKGKGRQERAELAAFVMGARNATPQTKAQTRPTRRKETLALMGR